MIRNAALALAFLAVFAAAASAGTIYTTSYNGYFSGSFGKLDTATGVWTSIKSDPLSGDAPHSLAYDGSGGFYTAGTYYTFHSVTTSGVTSQIGSSVSNYGMSSGNGKMYAYDYGSDALGTINTATGAFTMIGNSLLNSGAPIGGRLAFQNGTLYGAVKTSGIGKFGTFNTSTGVFTATATDTIYASTLLASDGTTLYGLNGSNLYTLDPATGGVLTTTGLTGVPAETWSGAAFGPVPEPATMSLLALGGLALLKRRRK